MFSASAWVHKKFLNFLTKFDRKVELLKMINCTQIVGKQPGQVVKEHL